MPNNKEITVSLDDILNDDPFDLLSTSDNEDIFTLKNIPKIDRAEADFIAQRKVYKNFDQYEALFIQCQHDLKHGKRKLIDFHENNLVTGNFFCRQRSAGLFSKSNRP